MGGKLPRVTARELIKVLEGLGFVCKPLAGTSHRRFTHSDGRRTTVPVHQADTIGPGLLRKILRDINLSPEEFAAKL